MDAALSEGFDAFPVAAGLYCPSMETSACGVGLVVKINGEASHNVIADAKACVECMKHRGGEGSDSNSGDGAGIMTSIPHALLVDALRGLGLSLPDPGKYATGNVFFTKDGMERSKHKVLFNEVCEELGLRVLGWRKVPQVNTKVGVTARSREPHIEQPFVVAANPTPTDTTPLERRVYLARRTVEKLGLPGIFFCSLCTRTIVYKGQLTPEQLFQYYPDLMNPLYVSHFALSHTRFSTNTFPSWGRAQPCRVLAHNGEINTLTANANRMAARESTMLSSVLGDSLPRCFPVVDSNGSDSQHLDNVIEFLQASGDFTLPEIMMMLVPEAYENDPGMRPEKRAFYHYNSALFEPWDGPALMAFSDGRYCGAILDRNGLRPARYYLTSDGYFIMGSEAGVVNVAPEKVIQKGRLKPGRMLLVDTVNKIFVHDDELKMEIATRYPYEKWLHDNVIRLEDVVSKYRGVSNVSSTTLPFTTLQKAFGYTQEHVSMIVLPMGTTGYEPLGSMGTDTPLACLSRQPRLLFDYFQQNFAQVTNPPIDPIREAVIMSLETWAGPSGNVLQRLPGHCHRILLPTPILSPEELQALCAINTSYGQWSTAVLDATFPTEKMGGQAFLKIITSLCSQAEAAVKSGAKILVLSQRNVSASLAPIPSLLACGVVHQHLLRNKLRANAAIIVETGDAREVHHMCALLGYGADAICPFMAFATLAHYRTEDPVLPAELSVQTLQSNYIKACNKGILKVMSKVGISTLKSYKAAQQFEALGVHPDVIRAAFTGTISRIKGVSWDGIAQESCAFHALAFPSRGAVIDIPDIGEFNYRNNGEKHTNEPSVIAFLQDAVKNKSQTAYDKFREAAQTAAQECSIRGLLDFKSIFPIPLNEVEPAKEIVKRFVTGAMSYGSISKETHETLAIAMNRIHGKSNTGEGGEDTERFATLPNGDSKRSAIKQVASGRFGVTIHYLSEANEIQIKMAQGAKPGEGGELPGYKVTNDIAATRHSTPGVGLISPPPHHDIYSIEDLKQLIYDLKCANPSARISVKLVSKAGVGVIASGCVKAHAEHLTISGDNGGTGAAVWTGIKHCGVPWELGLAEAHQTLVLNDLRGRVTVQADGSMRTGRDVVIASLLGADEMGFATVPLIALGCTMMRKCHLNTCPVGIATQDPFLRKKFAGTPEHVVNYFFFLAEEVRELMAKLGFKTMTEMTGHTEMLFVNKQRMHPKSHGVDLAMMLVPAYELRQNAATTCVMEHNHELGLRKDNELIQKHCVPAIRDRQPVKVNMMITNVDRDFGTTLSHEVCKATKGKGLTDNLIHLKITGHAGQSLGAFLINGITIELEGDSNDYVGKGLCGGTIIVYPPKNSAPTFKAEDNTIIGNVCLYGATSGSLFVCGGASERFCVRNSGATAVCEFVGDHCCEYMTGGFCVVVGGTGRNFAAGMSGGIAFVLDEEKVFKSKCNLEMVTLESVADAEDALFLENLLRAHVRLTGSHKGQRVLKEWATFLPMFVKVMPNDYKAVLAAKKRPVPAPPVEHRLLDIEDIAGDSVNKVTGFMMYKRKTDSYAPPLERIKDFAEITTRPSAKQLKVQAGRCMDCGVPFCQSTHSGCPLSNVIPSWNNLVHKGQMSAAWGSLMTTNNFPEFTGRVCPAPCEGACVLGINAQPVAIKSIECSIIDTAWIEGWVVPSPPKVRTGKFITVIGSGPAGLAVADQLNKAGHTVTLFERSQNLGGLLMYGIPNPKLDKAVVQRRVKLMEAEGVQFVTGKDFAEASDLKLVLHSTSAVVLAIGSTRPRDLPVRGRALAGVHFAMEFLATQTPGYHAGGPVIDARGKRVVVIGGGDTGNDCIGTSIRHGAKSIVSLEILPDPPEGRGEDNPWPQYPRVFRVDYGHEEVKARDGHDPRHYNTITKEFLGDASGTLRAIVTAKVKWTKDRGVYRMIEVAGSVQEIPVDLVFIAMGFVGPEPTLVQALGVRTNEMGNIVTPPGRYNTSMPKVYAAGDCRRGQSLVVWGIQEGRECARQIDQDLMTTTYLPSTGAQINGMDFVVLAPGLGQSKI